MTYVHRENADTSAGSSNVLARVIAGGLRPKERLIRLKELGAELRTHGGVSNLAARGGEILTASIAFLPIRGLRDLQATYGAEAETVAVRLVDEAAKLAGWVWLTDAALGATPLAHTLKVLVHSAIEIRLVGELYELYGEPDMVHDPVWLNTILCAWAVGRPVAYGASAIVSAHDVAAKLRSSYLNLVSDDGRITRLVRRGRDGSEHIREFGLRLRRRLRLHPSTWEHSKDLSLMEFIASAVKDDVSGSRGRAGDETSAGAYGHLSEAWSQHKQARLAAAQVAPGAGNAPTLTRLIAAVDAQEQHLRSLTERFGAKVPETRAPAAPQQRSGRWQDPLLQAHVHLGLSDDAVDRSEDAGFKPRRLATWSPRSRNVLVYLVMSLGLIAPVVWLAAAAAGDSGFGAGQVAVLALAVISLPLLTYIISLFAIGKLFRPLLGGRVARSPVLGFVLAYFFSFVAAVVGLVVR